ncbi:hypothetical protein J6590_013154 [Homalodisca vitripennis]|nr:hypothetical protein J6590_013154 [Homalodisca vitripennis]
MKGKEKMRFIVIAVREQLLQGWRSSNVGSWRWGRGLNEKLFRLPVDLVLEVTHQEKVSFTRTATRGVPRPGARDHREARLKSSRGPLKVQID